MEGKARARVSEGGMLQGVDDGAGRRFVGLKLGFRGCFFGVV